MDDSITPSLPSIWASMNSWFTPTVLFVFLNLMIATILFTSNSNNNKQDHKEDKTTQNHQNQNQNQNNNDFIQSNNKLTRSPSILHRLRSFNFHPHRSQQDSSLSSSSSSSSSSPPTHQNQQQIQESLEIAATQYVFNHPFSHQNDSTNPSNPDLNPDPTRFESFGSEPESKDDQFAAFNHTNEVLIANNAQTHFVFENNHTIEKVTTHFDFGSENPEKDPGFEEMLTREEKEEENDEFQSLDEVYSVITGGGGHVNRTKSDTIPASGELPVKLPAKMKKSASLKSAFNHFEEEKIVEARRPATVRERRSAARAAAEEDDVEVDAKADDFINKFKHQLKLQRLDSIIRYKDMVNRGGGK